MSQLGNIEREMGQLSIPSDIGRDLLESEIVIRDPVNVFEANLPGAITDDVFGAVDELEGAVAGQAHPARFMRAGEREIRIQDNATITLYADIMPSASDAGSAVTATIGGHIFGRALEAISSGTTNQSINCEIFADGQRLISP